CVAELSRTHLSCSVGSRVGGAKWWLPPVLFEPQRLPHAGGRQVISCDWRRKTGRDRGAGDRDRWQRYALECRRRARERDRRAFTRAARCVERARRPVLHRFERPDRIALRLRHLSPQPVLGTPGLLTQSWRKSQERKMDLRYNHLDAELSCNSG